MSGTSRTVAVVAGYAAAGALAVALWPGAMAGAGPFEQPTPTPTETPMLTPPAPDPAWRPEHLLLGKGDGCALELTLEYPDSDVTMCWEPGCVVVVFDGAAPGVACGSVDTPPTSAQPDPLTLRYDSSASDCVEVTPPDRDSRDPGPCPPPADCPVRQFPFGYEPLRLGPNKLLCAIITKNPYVPPVVTRPPSTPSRTPDSPPPVTTAPAPDPRPTDAAPTSAAPTAVPPPATPTSAAPAPAPTTTAPGSPVPAPVTLPDPARRNGASTVPWLALPLLIAAGGGAVVWMRRARG